MTLEEQAAEIARLKAAIEQTQRERDALKARGTASPAIGPQSNSAGAEPSYPSWSQVEVQRQIDLWGACIELLRRALGSMEAVEVDGWGESDQCGWLESKLSWIKAQAVGQQLAASRRLVTYKPEEAQ